MADVVPKPGYQGTTAAVQCGRGGLMVNLNPSQISLKNVIQAEGTIFRSDHWRKEPGTSLFGTNNTPVVDPDDAVIVALNDWHPTEAVQRMVTLRGDGYVYFSNNGTGDIGAFQSTFTSGSGTRFGYFVTGGSEAATVNRKLFLFRNNAVPYFVDGDATDTTIITNPAADWSNTHPPIVGIINNQRLVASGVDNAPHMIYASKFGDQTDFTTVSGSITDPQAIPIFPGVGERVYGLRSYQGFVVVFKYPRGIFLFDMRDTDPGNWLTQQVTDAIGIAQTPYAALQMENDILFLGSDGQFYLFSAVLAAATGQQNMEIANLGMALEIYEYLLTLYDRDLLFQVQSVYQPFWQMAQFTVPRPGDPQNSARVMFDFAAVGRKGGDPRFSYSYRDKAASFCLWRDPSDFIDKPMFGDYSSNVIQMEVDTRTTWNAATYPFVTQTPYSNLGEFENLASDRFVQFANHNKIWDTLELEYLAYTDATLTVSVFVDGQFRQTMDIPLTLGGDPLAFTSADTDAFVIGTSALSGGAVPRAIVKRLNCGDGRRISFLFENNNYGEDIALTHFFIYFRVGDTTQKPLGGNV